MVEYDPIKREDTLRGRGLDMARAEELFDGPTLTTEDMRFDYGKQRFISILFLDGRMIVIAWTMRGRRRRIISMRKANDREKVLYRPRFR